MTATADATPSQDVLAPTVRSVIAQEAARLNQPGGRHSAHAVAGEIIEAVMASVRLRASRGQTPPRRYCAKPRVGSGVFG